MTKERKSFILHFDSLDVIDELDNNQIAELFKAIKDYNLWEEISLTWLMKAVFIPFKNQFDRDIEAYTEKCLTNAQNGRKGGRPKLSQKKRTVIKKSQEKPSEVKKAYNDSKSDNKSNSKNNNLTIIPKGIEETSEPPSYWNKEINETLWFLTQTVWVDQFKETVKMQRQYWNHIVNFVNKHWKEDFIQRLKGILSDEFKANNCNSIKYLYNEIKSYRHSPIEMKEEPKITVI